MPALASLTNPVSPPFPLDHTSALIMSTLDGKDPTRVAAGLKAAMHNPNVSAEAKDNAAQRLEEIVVGAETNVGNDLSTREAAGYKATLSNPNASLQAKRHAEEVLESGTTSEMTAGGGSDDLHQTRVNAGYKATINNPNVSEEAKEHARDYLAENE
ncbi:unnamed protein product [Peniophora sp. CBMAI 1063]|nr:unnamed protein product [Peniophora sp. CBMAI 1063]